MKAFWFVVKEEKQACVNKQLTMLQSAIGVA